MSALTRVAARACSRGKGSIVATPEQVRRRGRWSLVIGASIAALVLAAVAIADNTIADGDGVTPVENRDMAVGNVDCGVAKNKIALIAISRNGNGNVLKNSTSATVSIVSVTGPGLSAVMGASNTISIPGNWDTSTNNTLTTAVSSTVTVNSPTAPPVRRLATVSVV